jgi:hypothetical protein
MSDNSLQEEYDDYFNGLGPIATGFYTFIHSFRIILEGENATLYFGKSAEDGDLDVAFATRLRVWLKEQKKWIRSEQTNASLQACKQRMWFLVSRFIEEGIFTSSQLGKIMYFMDVTWEMMCSGHGRGRDSGRLER